MTNIAVIALIALLISSTTVEQKLGDGFYMTVKCSLSSKVVRQNRLNYTDQICLAQQPFLSTNEIYSVSKMVEAGGVVYFDITLTRRATDLINSLNATIPNEGIAIVIDDQVQIRIDVEKNTTIDNILRIMIEPSVQNPNEIRQKIADIVSSKQ
jgi:hypothetical protein